MASYTLKVRRFQPESGEGPYWESVEVELDSGRLEPPRAAADETPLAQYRQHPSGRRWFRRLAGPAGLSDFGVSHVVLQPGGVSSQRHWHDEVDEFLVVLSGEALLVEDEGENRNAQAEA